MEVEELISSSSSGCSAPAPALLSKKRKSETESLSVGGSLTACMDDMMMSDAAVADTSLSEQIKRFRISNSPGFLRLKSDLQSYDGSAALLYSYRFPDEPDAVILHFSDDPRCPAPVPPVPRVFRVCVPKYYPHQPPWVTCLDASPGLAPYLDEGGRLQHSVLGPAWSPIYTIAQVVELLSDLRQRLGGGLGPG